MRIRKQVDLLTLADVEENPVWEFALDEEGEEGQDEETVRPYQLTPPLDPSVGLLIVRAKFALADGAEMEGYLTPPFDGSPAIGSIQPTIVTDQGQVGFWYGIVAPDKDRIAQNYRLLGKSPSQVFPLKFRSTVEIMGGPIEGELNGFLFYEDSDSQAIKTVR